MIGTTFIHIMGKKLAIDAFTEPENIIKFILYFLIAPILILILIFIIPIFSIISIPNILIDGKTNSDISDKQLETIAIYQDAPAITNQKCLEWVDKKKREYSGYDDIVVSYNFGLTWQHLMAIDSVVLKQDFNNADKNNIIKMAESFVLKSVNTETYHYTEPYQVNVTDAKGNTIIETRTRYVTRHRAIINISTKSFDRVLNELNFSNSDKQIINNIYNNIINADIEGSFNIYDDINMDELKEYPPGNANLPYFNQTDKRWGYYSYGKTGTIKSSGCGPTALAMVVAGLTKRYDINPKSVADWSVANGYRVEGQGSRWSLITDGGRHYGLKVVPVSRMNPKGIVQALSQGHPIIAIMGRGHFTKSGHFIVLRGITSNGKILVHDPVSVSRSNFSWDLSIILNESSTSGGVNGCPFWLIKP